MSLQVLNLAEFGPTVRVSSDRGQLLGGELAQPQDGPFSNEDSAVRPSRAEEGFILDLCNGVMTMVVSMWVNRACQSCFAPPLGY